VAVPQGRFFGGGLFGRPVVGLRPIGGGFGGLGGLGGLGGFGKLQ
jgi:hypothetical protein